MKSATSPLFEHLSVEEIGVVSNFPNHITDLLILDVPLKAA